MTSDRPTHESNDLDAFKPSPPGARLDDKAANLEREIQSLKSQFNKERVTYHFVIGLVFNLFVIHATEGNAAPALSVIGTVILLYSTARWLDHPWLGDTLSRWHDLLFTVCERRFLGKSEDKTEPLPDEVKPVPEIEKH